MKGKRQKVVSATVRRGVWYLLLDCSHFVVRESTPIPDRVICEACGK